MYKVFLVEDEIVVREGIRNSIPWAKTPYILTGEAPDGEMALSIIRDIKPDILITDIRMPFMDGLTLSRIVKKTLPWIKIIILSGHDEFEYAREAISIGVEEYLLKPVSSSDMLETLDKIAKRIDTEKEELLSIEYLRQQVQSHSDVLRERWLFDFVNREVPIEDAIEKARELKIDLIAHAYIVAIINVSPPQNTLPQLLPVKKIIKTIIEKYTNVILFGGEQKKYVLLIKSPPLSQESAGDPDGAPESGDVLKPADPHEYIEESVYSIAQAIKYEVERNTECKIAVGIGPLVERLREINKSYFRAEQIIKYQARFGLFQISDSTDLSIEKDLPDQTMLPDIDGDILWAQFRYASRKDIDSIIQEYTKLLGDVPRESEMLEYYIFGEILVAASKIIEELNGDIKEVIPFSLDQYEIKKIINSREVFYEKLRALFNAVIEFRDSRTRGRYQSVILKAKEYIDRHYADQDISLHTVASYVGISPNHLSTVFAQETGENFIEYLTRVRIEKAKQFLVTTAMKNADIAYETGFNDPHYFSFIFKKNTGLSPREYRLSRKA
ncbi:MAG: response regulator [Treponema sp.]|jgi:two-component system response regulator YesN|nr:response regulator [Treponema sp.]